ncbi:MAG: FadR/GntR family transcriptional regulator [Myxococcota bacterium]
MVHSDESSDGGLRGARLRPVERRSFGDAVVAELSEAILHGRYQPGESLPPEHALCEQLGVRRGALREGLKRLEQAGLVEIRHGGGTRVRDYRRNAGLEVLPTLLRRPDGRIDADVVRSVMEMRSALAPDVARQAARRRSDAQLSRLSGLVEALTEAGDEPERRGELSGEIWDAIVDASQNVAYRLAYNALLAVSRLGRRWLPSVLSSEVEYVGDYGELVLAIRDHDTEAAGRIAHTITTRGQDALDAALRAGTVDAALARTDEDRRS